MQRGCMVHDILSCVQVFLTNFVYHDLYIECVLWTFLSGVMMCFSVSVQFLYNQVSLTKHTDRDSYSHQLVYPHRERFFIEPKSAASAVKCRISVSNSIRELSYLLVIPFSPKKGTHGQYNEVNGITLLDSLLEQKGCTHGETVCFMHSI